MIQPLARISTTTAMPMLGSALLISHISRSLGSTPGAVSRPGVDPMTAAVIGRMGRWISSSAAPAEVVVPNSTYMPISQAAAAPPSRLMTNRMVPLINQMAGVGTISLMSSDETTRGKPFVMRCIEQAQARREKLRDLINAARRARGVREFDMVQEATMP